MGLDSIKNHHPLCLSKGQRFRLAFSSLLEEKSKLLLLDEPTSGQDPVHINAMLCALSQNCVKAILIVSHEYELIKQFCNRYLMLEKGCLTEFTNPELFVNNKFDLGDDSNDQGKLNISML